jgi:hypothetical protein
LHRELKLLQWKSLLIRTGFATHRTSAAFVISHAGQCLLKEFQEIPGNVVEYNVIVLLGDFYLFLVTHSEHIRALGSGLPFARSGESSDSAQLHLRTVSRSPALEIRWWHPKTSMQRCNKYQPITFPWLPTSRPV